MRRAPSRRLHRSRRHRVIAGVAGGIADYFGINPTIVRVAWVVGGILMPPMSAPIALGLYLLLAVTLPPED